MFKTSHVVYLVIVFFLMRHFKVFNMIDKKTKIKDKNYLLAFTFAVLLFGAHVLEMFVHELVKRVPMLKLPRFMDDRIYVDVPIVEGHAPLCQMKYGAPNESLDNWTDVTATTTETTLNAGGANPDAECIYNLDPDATGSRWRHVNPGVDDLRCGCDPSTANAEDVNPFKNDAPTEDQVLRSCNSGQLDVGICSAAAEQVSTGPGDTSLLCCHSQKVTNYYAYLQGLWNAHADPNQNLDGHEYVRLQGDIAEAQYGAHRLAQIGSEDDAGTIAARIAGDLNLGTYTVPGRGGGGGGNAPDEPSVEPMCNDPADGTRSDCAWGARLAADGSATPIPEGERSEDACPTPCVFVAR